MIVCDLVFLFFCLNLASVAAEKSTTDAKSFYDFVVTDANGQPFELSTLRGTVSLVVNVASQCGYTNSHYKALVALQNALGSNGKFQVLAFPCNQFGGQEPDGVKEIVYFATENYKVNFMIFDKIDVKGSAVSPAFRNLIDQSGYEPTWNFWKYLVDGDGKVLNAWGPNYSVDSIITDVTNAVRSAGGDVKVTMKTDTDEL